LLIDLINIFWTPSVDLTVTRRFGLQRPPRTPTQQYTRALIMSSHVVVLDATARRATIKTTPGKYLTDILQEACKKLGLDANQYGLK
jgi:hypothetical protein